MKMNPEAKRLWLEALRSGKFKQVTEALKKNDGFCCLGVLCDVAIKHGVDGYWDTDDGSDIYVYPKYGDAWIGREEGTLPPPVREWAGLGDIYGDNPDVSIVSEVTGETRKYHLSALNDDEGYTFEQIADLVDKQL